MDPIVLAMARGGALELLRGWLDRERPITAASDAAYMETDLLLRMLARRGYPMSRNQLNGSVLTYLRDAGLAEYRTSTPAGPQGPTLLLWRITHEGLQVLEGTRTDAGVQV